MNTNCYSCNTTKYLDIGTKNCVGVSSCTPPNSFADSLTNRCLYCDYTCDTCIGYSTNCRTCTTINTFINVYLFTIVADTDKVCLVKCPNGYYG